MSASLSPAFFKMFIDTATAEIGRGNLPAVLEKADMATNKVDFNNILQMNAVAAAEAYSLLQHALRVYYGRGARGVLLRVGHNLWNRTMAHSGLGEKVQTQFIKTIPLSVRRKAALDYAVKFLGGSGGPVSAYTLDLDLFVQDQNSAATLNQKDNAPICYVTQGFLQEVLFWATGREHDVIEVSCRAMGGQHCEFKIQSSGPG